MSEPGSGRILQQGTAVCLNDRGLLIIGPSGCGKTCLALELIALGATLISDDQVEAERDASGTVRLSAPTALAGKIEIRGAGILNIGVSASAPLYLIADLGAESDERMPLRQTRDLCGTTQPVILCRNRPSCAASLMAILLAKELPDPEARF